MRPKGEVRGVGPRAAAGGAVLLFVTATVWMTRPLVWRAADHLAETCDTLLNAWILAWDLHALTTNPLGLFDANIFHPVPGTLALSEHMLGNLPLFAPVVVLTGNPALALNVVILASFVLSGLTMSWLVHHWTGRPGPSVAAGFVFAFVPYRIAELYHMQLLSLQWLPLAVCFEDRWLRDGGRRAWLGFTAFTLWQCLVSYYLCYLTVLVVGVYGLVVGWRLRHPVGWRRPAALALGLGVVALAMLPLTLPYGRWQRRGIIPRYNDLARVRADPDAVALADPVWSYLSIPRAPEHIYAHLLTTESRHLAWEKPLFLGFLPLATLVLAAALARRAVNPRAPAGSVAGLAAVLLAAYVLSLGPWLTWNDELTGRRLPAWWLAQLVPGLSGIRAWSRFGLGVAFALAGLFGIALARLTARAGPWTRRLVLAGVLAVLALEYDVTPLTLFPAPPRATPAHAWLAQHGDGGPVLVLPTGQVHPCVHARYMYHSTVHWLPLASGYSGYAPPRLARVNALGLALPAPDALARARRRGLRWLVVERGELPPEQRATFAQAEAAGHLVPAARFPDETIYDLGRPPS